MKKNEMITDFEISRKNILAISNIATGLGVSRLRNLEDLSEEQLKKALEKPTVKYISEEIYRGYVTALLHYDKEQNISVFSVRDIEKLFGVRLNKAGVVRLKEGLQNLKFIFSNEEYLDFESLNGESVTYAIIPNLGYKEGIFFCEWSNNMPDWVGENGIDFTTVDYSMARNLKARSFSLYESIKTSLEDGQYTVNFSLEEIRKILKVADNTSYGRLNARVLSDIQGDLAKNSDIIISSSPVKEGRKTVGVEISIAKNKNFEGAITESQYNVLSSIKAQYENLLQNAGSESQQEYLKEKLSRLKNLNYMTKLSAQKLISELSNTKLPKQLSDKMQEEQAGLEKTRNNYDDVLEKRWSGNVLPEIKINLENLLFTFSESERRAILEYALKVAKENNAQTLGYVISIMSEWSKNELKTVEDVKRFKQTKYGEDKPTYTPPTKDFMDGMTAARELWGK